MSFFILVEFGSSSFPLWAFIGSSQSHFHEGLLVPPYRERTSQLRDIFLFQLVLLLVGLVCYYIYILHHFGDLYFQNKNGEIFHGMELNGSPISLLDPWSVSICSPFKCVSHSFSLHGIQSNYSATFWKHPTKSSHQPYYSFMCEPSSFFFSLFS